MSSLILSDKILSEIEEPLKDLNLGENDIKNQDLDGLSKSLERIESILKKPNLKFLQKNLAYIADDGATVFHPLLYPLLLSRKQKILDRIEILKKNEQYNDIEGVLDSNSSIEKISTTVKTIIEKLRKEDKSKLDNNLLEYDKLKNLINSKTESFERTAKAIKSFFEKETITSLLGFILLIGLTTIETIAMFSNTEYKNKEKIDTVFLILIGYYFGTTNFKRTNRP